MVVEIDESLPSEGFRLRTNAERIYLQYRDARGLRYGQCALDQLRSSRDFSNVLLTIEDWPDFAVRGFLLDIADDRVPTQRTLLRLIELLSLSRINQLELYTQHTYAYKNHDVVWSGTSPLTAAEMMWLDDQCAARGIDLVPNQNILGHMERWLSHEAYVARSENAAGYERLGQHFGPSTLAPTEENVAFITSLLEELVPLFRTRRINVGADEPWELGRGVSGKEVAEKGLGRVYFEYVSNVMKHWTEHGYQVEFWADIFGEHPELMGQVPTGAIPIVWQYDSPSLTRDAFARATEAQKSRWESIELDVETLRSGFRGRAKVLTEAGERFWVAPGTSAWQTFTGRLDNAVENMIDAAEVGLEYSSDGYINTTWGDHGMYDPPAVWFAPILFGGGVSWNLSGNRDVDLAQLVNDHVTLDPTGITGQVLVDIGHAAHALDAPLLNGSPLFTVLLHRGNGLEDGVWPGIEGIERADEILAVALETLEAAEPAALDGDIIVREARQAIRFARFGAEILRLGPNGVDSLEPGRAKNLLTRLDALLQEHRVTWLLRSRPGGLEGSVQRLSSIRRALNVQAAKMPLPETDSV